MMISKLLSNFFIFLIITSCFLFYPATSLAAKPDTLSDYLAYFYNRYSANFDEHGWVFKMPGYGVEEFSAPDSARRELSIAAYYRYTSETNKDNARAKIREAILAAENDLQARLPEHQSFSDAFAEMTILALTDDIPYLLSDDELKAIHSAVKSRALTGILAPDTSNRAALSAVYWQVIVNNLAGKNMITPAEKNYYDALLYAKIKKVMITDIDAAGWYRENTPSIFNPHYHMITAFALASYAELTGDIESYLLAKKMTDNLRAVSFPSGLVEARLGSRPVGLGAQFYLGAGLLNAYFGYDDYTVYLAYAYGDRFFSDKKYPNRLEYHSTLKDTAPDYHDDLSFSNLAELALLNPRWRYLSFDLNAYSQLKLLPVSLASGNIKVKNTGQSIIYNNLEFRETPDGNYTTVRKVNNKIISNQ